MIVITGSLTLSSCVSLTKAPVATPAAYAPPAPPPIIARQDMVHVVAPGETLWRISKSYDVEIEDIVRANKLYKADQLSMGQKLIIPKAMPARSIIPLYPSDKWKYIIIHHSASDEGNALLFHKSHINYRGFNSLGYHFVIDNGSYGKPEGYIESSPRWIKQQSGAHCQAAGMNRKSIGICLVGNFSKEQVSDKMLSSLVYLVNLLRKYYKIPRQNIIGHGKVPGASTECPGTKFPWQKFFSQLQQPK